MSRARLFRHAASTFGTLLLSTLIGLASRILLSRGLGPEHLGEYTAAVLVPSLVVSFLGFGIDVASIHLVGSGRVAAGDGFRAVMALVLVNAIVALPLLWILLPSLSNRVLGGAPVSAARLALLALPVLLLTTYLNGLLQGMGKVLAYNAVALAGPLLSLGLLAALSATKSLQLSTSLVAWGLMQLAAASTAFILVARRVRLKWSPSWPTVLQLIRSGIWPYVANALGFASRRVDSLVLLAFLGTTALGQYSQATTIAALFWFAATAAATALAPEIARRGGGDRGALTAATCRVVLAVLAVAVVAWLLADRVIVTVLFGVQFAPAVVPLRWLFPAVVAASVEKVLAGDLIGRGRTWVTAISAAVAFTASAVGSLLLTRPLGAVGAALSSSLGAAAAAGLTGHIYGRMTGQHWRQLLVPRLSDLRAMVTVARETVGQWAGSRSV